MATQFASSSAPAPFLLRPERKEGRPDLIVGARRSTRLDVAQLLCALGQCGARSELAVGRADIAAALDISLCKVKRVLALFSLSGVIACEAGSLRVLDWRRLCSVAQLPYAAEEEEDLDAACAAEEEEAASPFTAAGDPACFV